jgi:hypothetical protein
MKLTTLLHLAPRLRMLVAIPPLPQYVFMAWCLVIHRDFIFYINPSITSLDRLYEGLLLLITKLRPVNDF